MPIHLRLIALILSCNLLVAAPPTDRSNAALPEGAVARFGSVRLFHGPHVRELCFSLDGKKLISCDKKDVRQWDVKTGQLLKKTVLPPKCKPCVLLPNGSVLVSFNEPDPRLPQADEDENSLRYRLIDGETGKELPTVESLQESNAKVACSPDGKLLAIRAPDHSVIVHEVASGKEIARLQNEDKSWVWSMVFSPDSSQLAVRSGPTPPDIKGEPGVVARLALWDIRQVKRLKQVKLHCEQAIHYGPVFFDQKGDRLGVSFGKTIQVFDCPTLEKRYEVEDESGSQHHLAFAKDNRGLFGVTQKGDILNWKDHRKPSRQAEKYRGFCGRPMDLNGETIAFADEDGRLRLIDLVTGAEHKEGRGEIYTTLCINNDTAASVTEEGQVIFWSINDGKEIRRHQLPRIREEVMLSPDGKHAVLHSWGSEARVFNVETGKQTCTVEKSDRIAVSPDGRHLLTLDWGDRCSLWDVRRGRLVRDVSEAGKDFFVMTFTPDGRAIVGIGEKGFGALEIATGLPRKSAYYRCGLEERRETYRLLYSLDGSTLLVFGKGHIDVHTTCDSELLHRLPSHEFSCVALSPNGRWLAIRERGAYEDAPIIAIHDLRGLSPVRARKWRQTHESVITALDFTPDGRHLVSAGMDGTALVWDMARLTVPEKPAPPPPPNEKERETWWSTLGAADPKAADEAMSGFIRHPSLTVPLFKARLRPIQGPTTERVEALIRELDSTKFAVRQQASRELEKLGEMAEKELEAVLEAMPSLEMATRVRDLLQKSMASLTNTDRLRELRAVEVLERIGSAAARAVLEGLAKGHPNARLTQEAKASLGRMSK